MQPLSGLYLVWRAGSPLLAPWLLWIHVLLLLAGACWLPVVWMQIRMRDMAAQAERSGSAIPDRYWLYLRACVSLGSLAFAALAALLFLMLVGPA